MDLEPSVAPNFSPRRAFSHAPQPAAGALPLERLIELLDLQDATLAVQRLRQWALTAAAPQPGERAVDLGSGTGSATQLLAAAVGPTGRATGVEPNEGMRAEATRRAAAAGSRAVFVAGVAGALPFSDASLELLWCERVLQHLDDPQGAIQDIARVLRPGGRAVLLDSDHASRVTSDMDLEVEHRLLQTFLTFAPNARAARHIPRQVARAGLILDEDIGSAALVMPKLAQQDSVLLRMVAEQAVRDGSVTQAEAEAALTGYAAAVREGVGFSAVTMFGFVARRP